MSRRNLTLLKLDDKSRKAQFPKEKHNRMISAYLKSGAIEISGADLMASPALEPIRGNMPAIFVAGETFDGVKAIFKNSQNVWQKSGSKNCMRCHLGCMDSSMIDMASSGYLGER